MYTLSIKTQKQNTMGMQKVPKDTFLPCYFPIQMISQARTSRIEEGDKVPTKTNYIGVEVNISVQTLSKFKILSLTRATSTSTPNRECSALFNDLLQIVQIFTFHR